MSYFSIVATWITTEMTIRKINKLSK